MTYDANTARTYYLNNTGSRAVSIDKLGNRETIPFKADKDSAPVARAVLYWQSLGNFAVPYIRIKGKAVAVYADSSVTPEYYTTYENKGI